MVVRARWHVENISGRHQSQCKRLNAEKQSCAAALAVVGTEGIAEIGLGG